MSISKNSMSDPLGFTGNLDDDDKFAGDHVNGSQTSRRAVVWDHNAKVQPWNPKWREKFEQLQAPLGPQWEDFERYSDVVDAGEDDNFGNISEGGIEGSASNVTKSGTAKSPKALPPDSLGKYGEDALSWLPKDEVQPKKAAKSSETTSVAGQLFPVQGNCRGIDAAASRRTRRHPRFHAGIR